jgi:hypothetical protein
MNLIHRPISYYLIVLLNALLTLLFAAEAILSLQWRMVHDSPILYYMGFLVARFGAVPYRDFFDMNMPGAHWVNALIGSIFGFNDGGFQLANLLILLTILFLIFLWLRSFGTLAAWSACVLFGVFFFQYGPAMSMQREFLTLPFLLLALISFPLASENKKYRRYFLTGLFVSLAVLIKPQSGLIIVVFLFAEYYLNKPSTSSASKNNFWHPVIAMGVGFALPLLVVLIYFLANQALGAFFETATRYWPLYNDINARLEISTGLDKFLTTLAGIQSIGVNGLWFVPALISFFQVISNDTVTWQNRSKVLLLGGGVLVSLIEVIVANKYWEYHWLPMLFFLILLASCGLVSSLPKMKFQSTWSVVIGLLLVVFFVLRPETSFWDRLRAIPPSAPQGGRVDEIAEYLKTNLQTGDTVQPLDWSNGAVQAMLVTQSRPATRYLYDFHFYHHISNPEIQFLRKDFLSQLGKSKPRVIIQFYENRPWVDGFDTTREFPELTQYLNQNYFVDKEKNGYRLWMRK